ncbi:MAG TPA: homoserine O-acetyltransferase [Ferruginibacter sp.]|nr:homoserine O-acetyltransferase [Ferruginibacter sp.]
MTKKYSSPSAFILEQGAELPELDISYTTYGEINSAGSNVVWICHALTANSNVQEWWPGMVGNGCTIDTNKYFVVCANIVGSCYGSSGPLSIDSKTGVPYFSSFPNVSIRDMVRAHILLRQHLGIEKIFLLIGGSMGGYQCLEWALMENERIENLFLLATSPCESAWGIAVHTAQRMALTADPTWHLHKEDAGKNGIKAARAIGMLTYRNYGIMVKTQMDSDTEKLDKFKASSYIQYQGEKLAARFNAYSYWLLTKAMDSHQLSRGRNKTMQELLNSIQQKTLIIGISSDILCPLAEQKLMASLMPQSTLVEIDSEYGHDGFLVEVEKISAVLTKWLM